MRKLFIFIVIIVIVGIFVLSFNFKKPERLIYGASFSRFHSDELELNWKEVYLAMLDDLKIKHLRFSAHWPLTEPEDGKYNFEELDFQMKEAKKRNASIILAIGRRLPGWPECHEPEWIKAQNEKLKTQNEQKEYKQGRILKYIEAVVSRYKDYENLIYWQVENEPYLTFFSRSTCGRLDEEFFGKEISFVKRLDPTRPILITDSGELGTWFQAYQQGDVFGTSLYLYIWWQKPIGPFRYPITPAFFRIKHNLVKLIWGEKPAMVIELSAEPWLRKPILETSLEIQLQRMGLDKFNEMINFSSQTSFDTFYLWGAEWWYWMKLQGHDEFWIRAKEIFKSPV